MPYGAHGDGMNSEAVHGNDAQCKQAIGAVRPFRDNNGNISEEFTAPTILPLQEANATRTYATRTYDTIRH